MSPAGRASRASTPRPSSWSQRSPFAAPARSARPPGDGHRATGAERSTRCPSPPRSSGARLRSGRPPPAGSRPACRAGRRAGHSWRRRGSAARPRRPSRVTRSQGVTDRRPVPSADRRSGGRPAIPPRVEKVAGRRPDPGRGGGSEGFRVEGSEFAQVERSGLHADAGRPVKEEALAVGQEARPAMRPDSAALRDPGRRLRFPTSRKNLRGDRQRWT